MPKLWSDTIESHRREVRDAILDNAASLVAEHGLRSVTMSQVAEATGIGRATLYKYFQGMEEILVAWHEQQVASHFKRLVEVRNEAGNAIEKLKAMLETYALIMYEYHGTELASIVHQDKHVAGARQHLKHFIKDMLADAVEAGEVRDDVAPDDLATYCFHALAASGELTSRAAVQQLVMIILAGLYSRT